MAELMTLKIEGLAELEKRLLRLTKKAQGKCLRKALAAGGRVLVKAAKANAPVGATKKLKKSITAKNSAAAASVTFPPDRAIRSRMRPSHGLRGLRAGGMTGKIQGKTQWTKP